MTAEGDCGFVPFAPMAIMQSIDGNFQPIPVVYSQDPEGVVAPVGKARNFFHSKALYVQLLPWEPDDSRR